MNFIPYMIVFIGSGLGGALRHGVNELVTHLFGAQFPFGILTINITGSLVLGFLTGYFAFKSGATTQSWQLFLTTGICGGYTTFSTFSQNTILLADRGQMALSALYVFLSVSLSLLGFFAGLWTMRQMG
jgi:CrcB protein